MMTATFGEEVSSAVTIFEFVNRKLKRQNTTSQAIKQGIFLFNLKYTAFHIDQLQSMTALQRITNFQV